MDYYCELKDRFQKIIKDHNINTELEIVKVQKLTPKEAIGDTGREDYPILKGKELLINAYYKGSVGQAFTDNAKNFQGSLREVLSLDLEDESNVPIFIATLNAVLRDLGLIKNTIHCKDGEPKKCSEKILEFFKDEYKDKKIVLVGLQPAMLEILSKDFDVRVLDLDVDNVGKERFGVIIEDGIKDYFDVINWGDVLLVTGSCCSNKTISNFIVDKDTYFYGTTIAGVAYLMGLNRLCFCAQ